MTAQWQSDCPSGVTCVDVNLAVNGTKDFNYTGAVQGATLKKAGRYKLEVWGAEGGGTSGIAGYGGYSYGNISASANQNLYIYVGGKGSQGPQGWHIEGGWNGGGSGSGTHGSGRYVGGGGGGTDIRTVYAAVTYQNYSYYTNNATSLNSRLIVAGGGGGTNYNNNTHSGDGGGYQGGKSDDCCGTRGKDGNLNLSYGGTQSSGGQLNSGFGFGGSAPQSSSEGTDYSSRNAPGTCNGGGGGGWYGGGASKSIVCNNLGGGGGSGYIGNSQLQAPKGMYCYTATANAACVTSTASDTYTVGTLSAMAHTANYANTGNGYARITYLGT